MEQQFSLSWNNFHGNLTKGFTGLLGKGEFVDVTIAVEGHLLQAHKVILSICSPYFKKMFQMNPCQHPIVVLRDVTHRAMKDLLQFMYHGEVSVKQEDLTSFIGTAEVLQIKGLTNKEGDEDDNDKGQEIPMQSLDTQNNAIDIESCISDTCDSDRNDIQNNEFHLLKQREFIEKLQRLGDLKRKSEETHKNYYSSSLLNTEKRPKLKDKSSYNEQNNHILTASNNYDNVKSIYNERPLDVTSTYSTFAMKPDEINKDLSDDASKNQTICENSIEMKTECDTSDIIVTDPAVCTTPKNYDGSKDGQRDSLSLGYHSPQDSALSLVVNETNESQLPVRYKYIYSRKGHRQLVHMNFVYTKHSTTHGKTSWRCVQYFSLNRCPATVETIDAMIYAVNHQHNHEDCYEKLTRNSIYEMCISPK